MQNAFWKGVLDLRPKELACLFTLYYLIGKFVAPLKICWLGYETTVLFYE